MSNTAEVIYPSTTAISDEIASLFARTFVHFSESFYVNAIEIPEESVLLEQWAAENNLPILMQNYEKYYYDGTELNPHYKALHSLWGQWYFGLVIPPMILMLLALPRVIDIRPERVRVKFHTTGRPEIIYYQHGWLDGRSWLDNHNRLDKSPSSLLERLYLLLDHHIIPVMAKIERQPKANIRLIWNNVGYLMFWYLREFANKLGPIEGYDTIIENFFLTSSLPDGRDNPLYRTVIPRNGDMERRTCCQRNKLPGVGSCHDCPLESRS
ncbi:siderophore-iron reductase FhuF [Yersinia rochesterensis]|uniref:Hydroxamate siderophore iron reductase FhuF n=1 Tax=Yersinia rochesterensis TaxID=1604335 RepID=A0A8D4N438_9GAMM|nr:siderophore-iron reductase FhuF [Yersinia rochesterensis]AYD43840.1 hydroxamate siderophore iron reductase FhuF [Yersinia rochesterensis]